MTSRRWTAADSMDLYNINGWGNNYFSVNGRGHISVHPGGHGAPAIDLKDLVDEVRQRGIGLPLLIRFSEIIKARVVELNEAFGRAMSEYGYRNVYRGVYPIKVKSSATMFSRAAGSGSCHARAHSFSIFTSSCSTSGLGNCWVCLMARPSPSGPPRAAYGVSTVDGCARCR